MTRKQIGTSMKRKKLIRRASVVTPKRLATVSTAASGETKSEAPPKCKFHPVTSLDPGYAGCWRCDFDALSGKFRALLNDTGGRRRRRNSVAVTKPRKRA